jgi:hypothetical protein
MIIRVEMFSHVLHIELARITEAAGQPPDNVPQPMVVYPEEPADPVGFRMQGWDERA